MITVPARIGSAVGAAALASIALGCVPSMPESPLRLRLLQAEDARGADAEQLALLRNALGDADPRIRALATRALGRLERPDLLQDLLGRLQDDDAAVRRQAAFGLGQSARPETLSEITMPLYMTLSRDADESVRAVAAWSLGRLPYAQQPALLIDAQDVLLRASLPATPRHDPTADAGAPVPAERLVGVLRGIEVLIRHHRDIIELLPELRERLRDLAMGEADAGDDDVRTLALAALAAAGALDADVVAAALAAPDRESRRLGAETLARAGASEATVVLALADADPGVRLAALRAAAQRGNCAALNVALEDPSARVRVLAIDQLGPCEGASVALLARARSLAEGDAWHEGAHALVALSQAGPDAVGSLLDVAARHGVWQVRAYAATAAENIGDAAILEQLAGDEVANVRSAAIPALARLTGHAHDDLYIDALAADEPQLTIVAAAALTGSADPAALPALRAALGRLEGQSLQTLHDPRVALRVRIAELTGTPPVEDPAPEDRVWIHSLEQLDGIDGAEAVVRMRGGGEFILRLLPDEAPTAALRFAEMARAGTFDGLTFHRVVANFVIQGGSPGANEYSGHGAYTRDEITERSHRRGTVGISTRGRDTGDGQIFINLVDNVRLDGDYTIFAEVISGMEVVDAVLEGDVIERVTLRPPH